MIEPLEGVPSGVLGFEAIGEVEASDHTGVLVPAVEAAVKECPIRLVFAGDFELFPLADRDAATAWAAAA